MLLSSVGLSQDLLNYPLDINLQARYGAIFDHRQTLGLVVDDHVPAFDVTISRSVSGQKPWHAAYRYPILGLGYYHANLGNADVLGQVNALYGHAFFYIWRFKTFALCYDFALGMSYLNKIFDRYTNLYNTSISTHWNAFVHLKTGWSWTIAQGLIWSGGIDFTHYSNGLVKSPNLGLNVISLYSGLGYRIGPKSQPVRPIHQENTSRQTVYSVIASAGSKQENPPGGRQYFISSLSVNVERRLSLKHQAGVGLDLFYDGALERRFLADSANYQCQDSFYAGIHIGYTRWWGNMAVVAQPGFYIWDNLLHEKYVYFRWGFRYQIRPHILANITLKTYYAKAHFIEWGLGYTFKQSDRK